MKFKFIYLSGLFLFFSCKTKEKLVYFQTQNEGIATQSHFTPIFQIDDYVSLQVAGDDPESVLVFNLPVLQQSQARMNGYETGMESKNGYLVDAQGMIQLPVIGAFHLAGLNRMEATEKLQQKIAIYADNPVVQLQILNYKITVLGEVRNPGTFRIPNERITILEAIGLSGDLKVTGVRKNVLVIREENGVKVEHRLDLTSKALFASPVYYLKQNDVVYIEPNLSARTESSILRSTGSILISFSSLIITTIILILR